MATRFGNADRPSWAKPLRDAEARGEWGQARRREAGAVQRDGLDSSGQIVAQRVEWLVGDVAPFSRRYFEVAAAPGPASSHRVRIFAFDFIQAALLQAP